jgi:hypothetical protein
MTSRSRAPPAGLCRVGLRRAAGRDRGPRRGRARHRLPAFSGQGGAVRGGGHGADHRSDERCTSPGRCRRSREAFFGFLTRIAGEAAAKRDLPDAISVAGSLREDLFAPLDLLLGRAQQAGAVRSGIETSDLIVLLKGMFAGLAGSSDPALHERVFAVLADGLRPRG